MSVLEKFQLQGEAPRFEPDCLPPGFAQTALNCRFIGGCLTPWMQLSTQGLMAKYASGSLAGQRIVSLYAMDIDATFGGPYYLHWAASELGSTQVRVDVIEGAVLGDEAERIYFTGLSKPRVARLQNLPPVTTTDLAIAAPLVNVAGAYPYRSSFWGSPPPTVAPTFVVSPFQESALDFDIQNGGAENGILFWTIESGSFTSLSIADVPSLAAFEGTRYFSFGSSATSEATQAVDMVAKGIVGDSMIMVTWQQAKGPNASTATVGFRFFDDLGSPIMTTMAPNIAPAGGNYLWNMRSWSAQVPPDAETMEVVIQATKVGGGMCDAYIDNIVGVTVPVDYSNAGDTLSGWNVSPSASGNPGQRSVTINTTSFTPDKAIQFQADENVPWINRNFSMSRANISIKYDLLLVHQRDQNFTLPGVSAQGVGDGVEIFTTQVVYRTFNGPESRGTGGGTIATGFNIKNIWVTVEITGTTSPTDPTPFHITIRNRSTNAVIVDNQQFPILSIGNFLYFKHYSNEGGDTARSFIDNIAIRVTAVSDEETVDVATAYLYTFVTARGEESAPSTPTDTLIRNPDSSVTVTTPTTAPAGYDVLTKRIYRLVGSNPAVFRLVDEIPLAQADYIDTKKDSELDEILPTEADWIPPPDNARSACAAPNGISFVLAGKQICPTPRGKPWAFPVSYRLPTDFAGVAAGIVDSDLIVATQANPYVVTGQDPANLTSSRLEKPQGCVSARGALVMEGLGFVYPSPDGLTAVTRQSVTLVTEAFMSRESWQALNPKSITGVSHDGKYFGFYDATSIGGTTGGFMFDPRQGGNGWTSLDFFATAAYSNPYTDELHLVIAGERFIWNKAATDRPYRYRSQVFPRSRPVARSCFRLRAKSFGTGGMTFRYWVDGVLVHTQTGIASEVPFRLPAVQARFNEQWELQGAAHMRRDAVTIADDMEELQRGS